MSGAWRKPCARPASRSSSSIRSGFATLPKRPDGWPRTIRSTRDDRLVRRDFPDSEAQPHDPAREEVDRLVQAADGLEGPGRADQATGRAQPPDIVVNAFKRDRQGDAGRTAQARGRHRRQDQRQTGVRAKREIIDSVPGLGDQAVAGVVAWFPELGRIPTRPPPPSSAPRPTTTTAASAGASAISRAGGASCAPSSICRSWAPPPSTIQCSRPTTNACDARGKEPKVALIACMRKLIVILNTMLARDETWSPPDAAAA